MDAPFRSVVVPSGLSISENVPSATGAVRAVQKEKRQPGGCLLMWSILDPYPGWDRNHDRLPRRPSLGAGRSGMTFFRRAGFAAVDVSFAGAVAVACFCW